jgi:hypothetical protein
LGNRCRASIKIGGTIRRADIEELAEAAYEDGAGEDAEVKDLRRMIELAAQNEEPVLFTAEDEIFDILEATCRELVLPYVRHTRACGDCCSEHVEFWEPKMHHLSAFRYACTDDGCPMLDYRQVQRLLAASSLERELRIMEHVHRFPYKLVIIQDEESVEASDAREGLASRSSQPTLSRCILEPKG